MLRCRLITRGAVKRLGILLVIAFGVLTWAYFVMIRMPGHSYNGPPPAPTLARLSLIDALTQDVSTLAQTIGPRNVFYTKGLQEAEAWIESTLREIGYDVDRQTFNVSLDPGLIKDHPCTNLIVDRPGSTRADEIIIIGAHYDTFDASPGANDNATGVAATLALARAFVRATPQRTLRFVFFVNEEPPFFQTDQMGSLVYARSCRKRGDDVYAMLSLETLGFFSDAPDSQSYPSLLGLLYPDTGNFIGFVGNVRSRSRVREVIRSFRGHARIPSEGAAIPGWITGAGWSDHWAFWKQGYPGLMVTDTAPFRYPHYHLVSDRPDQIDFERMSLVVEGLAQVIDELTNPD